MSLLPFFNKTLKNSCYWLFVINYYLKSSFKLPSHLTMHYFPHLRADTHVSPGKICSLVYRRNIWIPFNRLQGWLWCHDVVISGGSRISRRGGANLVGGAPTPEAATFRKFCMSKRKNLDPWGARAGGTPPGSATGDDVIELVTIGSKGFPPYLDPWNLYPYLPYFLSLGLTHTKLIIV